MSREFKTYEEAKAYALEQTYNGPVAYGIEKPTDYQSWTVKMLPGRRFRCGWELRCEAVEPW
jgi:hypothetical protein